MLVAAQIPDRPGAIATRLPADEVARLAARLGLTPPPSVVRAVIGAASAGPAWRSEARPGDGGAASRGSRVRDDDEPVDDDVRTVLTTICRPACVITIAADRPRIIYAVPGGGVAETERVIDGRVVLDHLSMPARSVLPSITHWTGLDRHPDHHLVPAGAFTVLAAELAQAVRAVADGELRSGVTILQVAASAQVESGAEAVRASAAAGAYARAWATAGRPGARSVTVTRATDDDLAVARVHWSDCGAAGLWLVEQDDALEPDLDALITLRPVTRHSVAARLRAALG